MRVSRIKSMSGIKDESKQSESKDVRLQKQLWPLKLFSSRRSFTYPGKGLLLLLVWLPLVSGRGLGIAEGNSTPSRLVARINRRKNGNFLRIPDRINWTLSWLKEVNQRLWLLIISKWNYWYLKKKIFFRKSNFPRIPDRIKSTFSWLKRANQRLWFLIFLS